MDIIALIARLIHIVSAIALLGGTLYAAAILPAALRVIDDGLRSSIFETARRRFYRVSHPALVMLLITGLYSFMHNMDAYKAVGPAAHGLIGTKMLLALAILVIVFAQTFGVIKGNPLRWARINLALGLIIVVLAVIVHQMRVGPAA